jgi:formyl-CoA transferase
MARDMLLTQQTREGRDITVPGIVPKLSATPGSIRTPAPAIGEDTDSVLAELGLSPADIQMLRDKKVIA